MAYIGNIPAESYASFETETFSVSATTNYTLSHAVTNENEIRLVINGVVQQPGSGKAYTASNTTLTLTSATASGDVMYAVYLGRALQTVNPPNASVGTAQLADRSVTSAKLASGAVANTPAFEAYPSGTQTISADSWTKLNFATERFDTDGKYNASTSKFTPTVSGKYYIYAIMDVAPSGNGDQIGLRIYKNGSFVTQNVLGLTSQYIKSGNNNAWFAYSTQISDTDDYFEIYGYFSDNAAVVQTTGTLFGAYKLIGV